jgi:hypothetical protein
MMWKIADSTKICLLARCATVQWVSLNRLVGTISKPDPASRAADGLIVVVFDTVGLILQLDSISTGVANVIGGTFWRRVATRYPATVSMAAARE